MSMEKAILAFAGAMVLLSVGLTIWMSPLFIWLTVFVGFNLLQSAFTGFCPIAALFHKFGIRPGAAL